MSDLQRRAREIRAKADELGQKSWVLRDIYLRGDLVRRTLAQAETEAETAADDRAARAELRRAKAAGPELAQLMELRQRGRTLEADLYAQQHALVLRDQRAAFERITDPEPEDPTLSLTPEFEPPTAA